MRRKAHDGCGGFWLTMVVISLVTGCSAVRGPLEPMSTAVYFSPNGGSTEAIIREINRAQHRIWVQAYSFTSAPIAEALIAAHKRGVEVLAVVDKSNQTDKYTVATFLNDSGIKTLIDDQHAIAHNKVMMIDNTTLITGSFNFTKAAEEHNAENLLVLNDVPDLAGAYADNIVAHMQHSQPYQFTGEMLQPPAESRKSQPRETRAAAPKRQRPSRRVTATSRNKAKSVGKRRPEPAPIHVALVERKPEEGEVRANRRSKVYRTIGCSGYNLINPDYEVIFVSERKAIAAGYRKAEACQ